MVVQQVDLVHIEYVAVGGGQDTGFEPFLTGLEDVFKVQRTGYPVLRCGQREVDDPHPDLLGLQLLSLVEFILAVGAVSGFLPVLAAEGASLHHGPVGENGVHRPHGRGFGRTLLSLDQHSAYPGVDDVEHQRPLHVLLPYDPRERKDHRLSCHIYPLLYCLSV